MCFFMLCTKFGIAKIVRFLWHHNNGKICNRNNLNSNPVKSYFEQDFTEYNSYCKEIYLLRKVTLDC